MGSGACQSIMLSTLQLLLLLFLQSSSLQSYLQTPIMTPKKTPAAIGNLVTSGHRFRATEVVTSPTSPLDLKILSPRGIVNREAGGVGLGIVAALENNYNTSGHRMVKKVGVDDEEEYTIVTRHMPNTWSSTKVYDGGLVYQGYLEVGGRSRERCLFDISAPRLEVGWHPAPDFLSCCHLCNKELHGKDVYMYRGEKGFCSMECRCREMGMEERREKEICGIAFDLI